MSDATGGGAPRPPRDRPAYVAASRRRRRRHRRVGHASPSVEPQLHPWLRARAASLKLPGPWRRFLREEQRQVVAEAQQHGGDARPPAAAFPSARSRSRLARAPTRRAAASSTWRHFKGSPRQAIWARPRTRGARSRSRQRADFPRSRRCLRSRQTPSRNLAAPPHSRLPPRPVPTRERPGAARLRGVGGAIPELAPGRSRSALAP